MNGSYNQWQLDSYVGHFDDMGLMSPQDMSVPPFWPGLGISSPVYSTISSVQTAVSLANGGSSTLDTSISMASASMPDKQHCRCNETITLLQQQLSAWSPHSDLPAALSSFEMVMQNFTRMFNCKPCLVYEPDIPLRFSLLDRILPKFDDLLAFNQELAPMDNFVCAKLGEFSVRRRKEALAIFLSLVEFHVVGFKRLYGIPFSSSTASKDSRIWALFSNPPSIALILSICELNAPCLW